MVRGGDSHSRIVYWLKIILPLIALAILSTLFLVSRNVGGDGSIPFSDVDLDAMARDQRLGAPQYAGTTGDGAAVSITADLASPAGSGGTATQVVATWDRADGARVTVTSARVALASDNESVGFDGGVVIETLSGYVMTTDTMTARLDRTDLNAPGAVAVMAPYGRIDAGGMTYGSLPGSAGGGEVLVFNRGVRLIYNPKN
jgi:lipopolysaccharide export system protein LptC